MRAVVLGPAERERIKAVRAHAKAHPYSAGDLLRMISGALPTPSEDERFRILFPGDITAVYCLEDQPGGLMRHVSFSIAPATRREGALPSPEVVAFLLEAFGCKPIEESVKVWVERGYMVHVLQLKEAP
jgi:hypothetical protein